MNEATLESFYGSCVTIAEAKHWKKLIAQKTHLLDDLTYKLQICDMNVRIEKKRLKIERTSADMQLFSLVAERNRTYKLKQMTELAIEAAQGKLQDEDGATKKMDKIMLEGGRTGSDNVKECFLYAATKLAPRATECVEALGYLWLRTPAFFFQQKDEILSELMRKRYGMEAVAEFRKKVPIDSFERIPEDLQNSDWDSLKEHIDGRVRFAVNSQNELAIRELGSMLLTASFGEDVHEYLIEKVCEARETALNSDTVLLEEKLRNGQAVPVSVVILRWPEFGGRNWATYKPLYGLLAASVKDDTDVDIGEAAIVYRGEGEAGPTPQERNKLINERVQIMDSNCRTLYEEEKYVHINACHSVKLLWEIMYRAVEAVKIEEEVLYGDDSQYEHDKPFESHWVSRRHAAKRVCKLARTKNVLAVRLLFKLIRDPHWMIRDIIIPDVAHMIRSLPIDASELGELNTKAIDMLCLMALSTDKVPGAKTDPKNCLKRIRVSCEKELTDMHDHGCPAETMAMITEVLTKRRDLLVKQKGTGGQEDPRVIFKRIISFEE